MQPHCSASRGARAAQAAAEQTASEKADKELWVVAKKLEEELGLATDCETLSTNSDFSCGQSRSGSKAASKAGSKAASAVPSTRNTQQKWRAASQGPGSPAISSQI
eukprot:2988136-Rhodomonas_salina.1